MKGLRGLAIPKKRKPKIRKVDHNRTRNQTFATITTFTPEPVIPGRVRCLGPGEDHWFWSTDRVGKRTCPACEATIRHRSVLLGRQAMNES